MINFNPTIAKLAKTKTEQEIVTVLITRLRLLAEGSDWKRDSDEHLFDWIIRKVQSK